MSKEILLYGGIYSSSVERFIEAVNDLPADKDLVLRLNTNGGSPEDMTGMIAKFQEFQGKKVVKVDGKAYSSGAFFLLYADSSNCEMTDVSKIMFHRASYGAIESDPKFMTEARWEYLNGVNSNLRSALESKVDSAEFERITGVSIDKLFSNDSRVDVFLTAKECKSLGLISKINNITPKRQEEIDACYNSILAEHDSCLVKEVDNKVLKVVNKKVKMTISELKAAHPETYNEVFALGVSQEKDRVGAWLVFAEVDGKRVQEGISSGKGMSQKDTAELTLKSVSVKEVSAIESESQDVVATSKIEVEAEVSEEEKNLKAFMEELDK